MGRLEELILSDSRRGMDLLAELLPADFCTRAGRRVLSWPRGRVLLITGFYVDGRGETDGPPGTKLLFDALSRLGFSPLVVTDPFCAAYFQAAAVPCVTFDAKTGEEELLSLLQAEKPVGLLSVERCGRTADGRYLNARGRSVGQQMAPLDSLFLLSDVPTLGIGDGGNEIGMGRLKTAIAERLGRIPCVVETEELILATVSNWGALGLCAALGQLPTEGELAAAYGLCPEAGLLDGITGKPTLSEDGFPLEHILKLRNDLEATI